MPLNLASKPVWPQMQCALSFRLLMPEMLCRTC